MNSVCGRERERARERERERERERPTFVFCWVLWLQTIKISDCFPVGGEECAKLWTSGSCTKGVYGCVCATSVCMCAHRFDCAQVSLCVCLLLALSQPLPVLSPIRLWDSLRPCLQDRLLARQSIFTAKGQCSLASCFCTFLDFPHAINALIRLALQQHKVSMWMS